MSDFLNRIDNLLTQKGISRRKFALEIDIPDSTIRSWSHSMPSADKVIEIATYFNVTPEWLLTGKEQGKKVEKLELSEEEIEILRIYRTFPRELKNSFRNILKTLEQANIELGNVK